jgi:hypothetical protein
VRPFYAQSDAERRAALHALRGRRVAVVQNALRRQDSRSELFRGEVLAAAPLHGGTYTTCLALRLDAGEDVILSSATIERVVAFPDSPVIVPGRVTGDCGHLVAESEWIAGFRVCERCPVPTAQEG